MSKKAMSFEDWIQDWRDIQTNGEKDFELEEGASEAWAYQQARIETCHEANGRQYIQIEELKAEIEWLREYQLDLMRRFLELKDTAVHVNKERIKDEARIAELKEDRAAHAANEIKLHERVEELERVLQSIVDDTRVPLYEPEEQWAMYPVCDISTDILREASKVLEARE